MPPGMVLELNGTLRGSPTETGTYDFRLCAKDLYGGEGCQNLAVVVSQPGEQNPSSTSNLEPSVSIDSITCKLIDVDDKQEPYTVYTFEILMSGTADYGDRNDIYYIFQLSSVSQSEQESGFKGAWLDDDIAYLNGAWTGRKSNQVLKRAEGDPRKIQWNAGGWIYKGQKYNKGIPAEILMHAELNSYGNNVSAQKSVFCSP